MESKLTRTCHKTELFLKKSKLGRLHLTQDYIHISISVAPRSMAWVCGHSLLGLPGAWMSETIMCCQKSMGRADLLSGNYYQVVCSCVVSKPQ